MTFNLARKRALEALAAAAYAEGAVHRVPSKPGAGIPGLRLDLSAEICHGIMRAKFRDGDWQGVLDAMRACSVAPLRRRRSRNPGIVKTSMGVSGGGDGRGAQDAVGAGRIGGSSSGIKEEVSSLGEGKVGIDGASWVPTEETYAIALEACGKVCMIIQHDVLKNWRW